MTPPFTPYHEAFKLFSPYDKVQEVNEDARRAGAALIAEGVSSPGRKTFIYVNNRMEGNALGTIEGMIKAI